MMWKYFSIKIHSRKQIENRGRGIAFSILYTALLIFFLAAFVPSSYSIEEDYTGTTLTCIACHNDTTFPDDTDGNAIVAPYKRPHNGKVMCEQCHRSDPHQIVFIQPDGSYGPKTSAASCPECHQTGIPVANNSNFTNAFMIHSPFSHSSNVLNGSAWGNYWTNSQPRTACIFCHNRTLHDVTALGRITEWSPNYIINRSIGADFVCSNCHYKGDANWTAMTAAFTDAGLKTPPEITNGTNWKGTFLNYFNHTIEAYTNDMCRLCHGRLLSQNAVMSEFVHNVAFAESSACLGCHTSPTGSPDNPFAAIDLTSFGKHKNINRTDGEIEKLTDSDCEGCHYNISNMYTSGFTTDTRICTDCHIGGNFSAPIIDNHKPPKIPINAGGKISTTAYCSVCHNNSISKYIYSVNASVGHYTTNASLVKTVNQTPMPRFGFMTQADAQPYNKECNNCHNPSNPNYGNATPITMPHINTGTCNECHAAGNATDLHNGSLGLPVTFNCQSCHTTYADRYGAPNMTGTIMASKSGCSGTYCHGADIESSSSSLNTAARHNFNRRYNGTPGKTDTVYLNGVVSFTAAKDAQVNLTSRVNDTNLLGGSPRVGGAEYYIDVDPGPGKGIPMHPTDGRYDAVNGAWENVNATIAITGLSNGIHTVYVRGMDIGKQWSAPQSATLNVQSLGYINGTVTSGGLNVSGANISVSPTGASTITSIDGKYSFALPVGSYNITATKRPTYVDKIITNVNVIQGNTTELPIDIQKKLTATISGTVSIA